MCPKCGADGVLEVEELTRPIDTQRQAISHIEIKSGCPVCGTQFNIDITDMLRMTLSTEALENMR